MSAETARNTWGDYDANMAYIPGNKVVYNGSSYLNRKPCQGVLPSEKAYWQLIARRGVDGEGAGDMRAEIYDPKGKAQDVFAYTDAHNADMTAHSNQRQVIATRIRDPGKPTYGLGGGGDQTEVAVVLDTGAYTGGAEVSVIVSGEAYDAENMSADGENAPDGTVIITKVEE